MYRFIILMLIIDLSMAGNLLFEPLPVKVRVDSAKSELGKALFHDTLLSKDRSFSCASCHDLANYGIDSLPTAIGIRGQMGSRNVPTVFNVRFNFTQFWDGRAKNLKAQALMPIENPVEMDLKVSVLIERLNAHSVYKDAFNAIYEEGITAETIADAIAEYEKTLISSNSKFDYFLKGNDEIFSAVEKEGFELFKDYGCVACHNGINVGGTSFQKVGIFESDSNEDPGRYAVTNNHSDFHVFKVPSLRNIEKTAPYFHNGSVQTLQEAVDKMARFQLGRDIPKDQSVKIVAFLKTLTGDIHVEK